MRLQSSDRAAENVVPGCSHRGSGMTIERTAFGSITIDGKTYEHDVIVRLSGEVAKRKNKLYIQKILRHLTCDLER